MGKTAKVESVAQHRDPELASLRREVEAELKKRAGKAKSEEDELAVTALKAILNVFRALDGSTRLAFR